LMRELCDYPVPAERGAGPSQAALEPSRRAGAVPRDRVQTGRGHDIGTDADYAGVIVPLQLRTDAGLLSFLSTTTVFGTPVDITLQELALESFFPADANTAQILHAASARYSHASP